VAHAQSSSTLKVLVGFPAGGAPDAVARAFADQWRAISGGTVVVENRAGASGKLAVDTLLNAPADGQLLLIMPASVLNTAPMIMRSVKYDSVRDFTVIGNVAEYGFGVAAGPASAAQDLGAFKSWARIQGKSVGYATPGAGTPQHFLGVHLEKLLGITVTHVPYRGGAAAIQDVMSGEIPLLITTEQLLVPHEGQGKLKTLFITSRERNARMPAVPTARELGLTALESSDWFGLFVKSGTPVAKTEELRSQLLKVLTSTGYRDAMKHMGYTVPQRQSANFAQTLQSERAVWAERVKLSGYEATD
jgi:tripartite-type tricarboxylate transporter receptor subunit TctC